MYDFSPGRRDSTPSSSKDSASPAIRQEQDVAVPKVPESDLSKQKIVEHKAENLHKLYSKVCIEIQSEEIKNLLEAMKAITRRVAVSFSGLIVDLKDDTSRVYASPRRLVRGDSGHILSYKDSDFVTLVRDYAKETLGVDLKKVESFKPKGWNRFLAGFKQIAGFEYSKGYENRVPYTVSRRVRALYNAVVANLGDVGIYLKYNGSSSDDEGRKKALRTVLPHSNNIVLEDKIARLAEVDDVYACAVRAFEVMPNIVEVNGERRCDSIFSIQDGLYLETDSDENSKQRVLQIARDFKLKSFTWENLDDWEVEKVEIIS